MPHSCISDDRLVLNARRSSSNLLRMDPTGTLFIRESFVKEIRRRKNKLRRAILEWLVKEDKLGLKKLKNPIRNAREFEFMSDPAKLTAFSAWLSIQLENDLLASASEILVSGVGFGGQTVVGPWTQKYIESAYKKGLINAYLEARRELSPNDPNFIDQTQEEFLRSAFLAPERLSKVQLLALRAFEQLRGFSSQMGGQLNTILAQGMIDGKSVIQIAREMFEKIDGLTEARALMIARTEIIHAHAEGTLDSFEELGIDKVSMRVEWSTAGDDRVCPQCATMEGKVFTIDRARGKIPLHPNCRCAWIPSSR